VVNILTHQLQQLKKLKSIDNNSLIVVESHKTEEEELY